MKTSWITAGLFASVLAAIGAAGFVATQANANPPALSEAQAIEIALQEVPGTVQDTELEDENGIQIYEIEVVDEEGIEKEIEINAETGEVMKVETEQDCKKRGKGGKRGHRA